MGFMAWLREDQNIVPDAAITVSTEDPVYTKDNLASLPIAKPFRSGVGATFVQLLFDFGTPEAASFAAIVNHNLTSLATIELRAGTTSSVTDLTVVMPYRQFDSFVRFASATYRYWRFDINDPGNPDNFIQVGYAMLGVESVLGFGFLFGKVQSPQVINSEQQTERGVGIVYELFSQTQIQIAFQGLNENELSTLTAIYSALRRNAIPVFVVLDTDKPDGFFVRWISQLQHTVELNYRSSLGIIFSEESRGRSLA